MSNIRIAIKPKYPTRRATDKEYYLMKETFSMLLMSILIGIFFPSWILHM